MAFHDVAANDWTGDAVYDWYEDVNGETDRHIFNADWCIEPWDDTDNNGDNVKVWVWTDDGWVEHNAPIEKTTLPEFRGKGYEFASRIESIDSQEMNMAFGKHAKRQKLEGQGKGSGSKGLEKICGDTLASDNSDNGGINKDLRHEYFENILDKTFGKDSANEYLKKCSM